MRSKGSTTAFSAILRSEGWLDGGRGGEGLAGPALGKLRGWRLVELAVGKEKGERGD